MTRICSHVSTVYTWRIEPETGDDVCFAKHCYTCDARLSMGPSNDEPWCVAEEMAAARIIASHHTGGPEIQLLSGADRSELAERWPGNWLALEVCLPEPGEWPWYISRSVAGQYEEQQAFAGVDRSVVVTLAGVTLAAPAHDASTCSQPSELPVHSIRNAIYDVRDALFAEKSYAEFKVQIASALLEAASVPPVISDFEMRDLDAMVPPLDTGGES